MALKKSERELVRMKYGGRCAYCGCELPKVWHADHFVACRRDLVAVTLLFWAIREPRKLGFAAAWIAGLLMDVGDGVILGQPGKAI